MKKLLAILIVLALIISASFTGYLFGKNAQAHSEAEVIISDNDYSTEPTINGTSAIPQTHSSKQLLNINVQEAQGRCNIIAKEDLGGNMDGPLIYNELRNVTIELDGVVKALEHAIRDGDISLAEIFTYARADAENGFCEISIRSKNGLSSFLYSYPEYDLKLIYDVYETPDGENHLISDMALYKPGGEIPRIYLNESDKILDLEDWGISLEVVETSADGITLSCTQSGGQQIGTLSAYAFRLIQDGKYMSALDGDTTTSYEIPETALSANSSTEFTIDWKDIYGTLSPGKYVIRVIVKDIYEESQVHPLMRNFYDVQHYQIAFTVS